MNIYDRGRATLVLFAFVLPLEGKAVTVVNGCVIKPHTQCPFVDLSGKDLSNVDLAGANLIYANLKNTNLTKAKLTNIKLTGANLDGANLTQAGL